MFDLFINTHDLPYIAPGGLYTRAFVICSQFRGLYTRGAIYDGGLHTRVYSTPPLSKYWCGNPEQNEF